MTSSEDLVRLCQEVDITAELPRSFAVEGTEVVVFRVGGDFFALENLCPHQHLSAFHRGHLSGYTVTCPMHGWSFDVRTGHAVAGSGRLKRFPLHRRDGVLYVERTQLSDGASDMKW